MFSDEFFTVLAPGYVVAFMAMPQRVLHVVPEGGPIGSFSFDVLDTRLDALANWLLDGRVGPIPSGWALFKGPEDHPELAGL